MFKKQAALLTTIALVLLCGCGQGTDVATVSQDSPALEDAEISEAPSNQVELQEDNTNKYDHNLVCDRWADQGSFKIYTSDDEFFDYDFNYSIPQIVDDTADAKEINYFIECLFEDMHNTMQRAAKEGKITASEFDSTGWLQTNYDCYWNESIASIVICSTAYFDNDTIYNVYNYDFATGKQVLNEDLFALKGITSEKFVENMRRAAAYSLDKEMQDFFKYEMPLKGDELCYADLSDEDVQRMYGDYLLSRAKTINEDNIDEFLPVYLDEQGNLQVITHLYNMGMYGDINSILSPVEWVNNNTSAFWGDLLDVISKDDGMYLIIYRDDWSDAVHDEFPTFEFAKEYKINGLYKNYKEARISWVGNGMQPYILLLSDDGTISYVDVWEGIASGYFCAVEPLWGLENIESFSDDSESGIVVINGDGKSIDVDDALYMMLSCKYADFEKNLLNLNNLAKYAATVNHIVDGQNTEYEEMIGFSDDQYHVFVRESYKTDNYDGGAQTGYITLGGMNEKGMVYNYSLVGENGELRGAMAINVFSYWDYDYSDFVEGAEETWLSGFDIFESAGNKIMLNSSAG